MASPIKKIKVTLDIPEDKFAIYEKAAALVHAKIKLPIDSASLMNWILSGETAEDVMESFCDGMEQITLDALRGQSQLDLTPTGARN